LIFSAARSLNKILPHSLFDRKSDSPRLKDIFSENTSPEILYTPKRKTFRVYKPENSSGSLISDESDASSVHSFSISPPLVHSYAVSTRFN